MAFNTTASSPHAVIRNVVIGTLRGSLRVRSFGALIDGLIVRDAGNARLMIGADTYFKEGPTIGTNELTVAHSCRTDFGSNCNPLLVYGSTYIKPHLIGPTGPASIETHPLVYNAKIYRSLNPDLMSLTDVELQNHWLQHGIAEGRQASLTFHSTEYLQRFVDLQNGYGATNYSEALQHFILYGAVVEQRPGTVLMDSLI